MTVKEFYDAIGGDYSEAKNRLINDAFISRMLAKFAENNTFDEILKSYKNRDFQTLFSSVHAFKGVVGNLALTSLYKISEVITEKTRNVKEVKEDNGLNLDEEIEELNNRYQAFIKAYIELIA